MKDIESFLLRFPWKRLSRMYGCAHHSIIGFISSEWIKQGKDNSILDGAPSHTIGNGRKGQQNADVLLCKKDKPFIVVEVESDIAQYPSKVKSLKGYLENLEDFTGLEFGVLVMSNANNADKRRRYKHHWDSIANVVEESGKSMVLISLEKDNIKPDGSILGRLRRPNGYSSWNIVKIDYKIYHRREIKEGNLWKQRT